MCLWFWSLLSLDCVAGHVDGMYLCILHEHPIFDGIVYAGDPRSNANTTNADTFK